MSTTVGEFLYKVLFKTDPNSKKEAENEMEDLSGKAKKLLGAIGIGFSIKGAYDAIKACVSVSSEVEEMQNKFDVVFRGMTDDVESWAQSYADAVGRNSNTIKGYLADSQNLFVGMGMEREAGAKLSEQMIELALDLASFNNLNEDDAVNAMTKALMGESESAKTLGAVLNDNTRAQAMQVLGLTGTYQALDEATKMQVNYQAILNQSSDAVGDCERSLDSYESTLKQTTAKLEEVKTLIGQFFMPTFKRVLSYANQGLMKLRDWISKLQTFADKIGGVEHLLSLLAATGAALVVALNFKKIVSGATALLKVLGGIKLSTLAIIAVVVLLVLLVDDFINFMQGNNSVIGTILENAGVDCDELREKIRTVWEKITAIFYGAKETIGAIVSAIGKVISKAFEIGIDVVTKFISVIVTASEWLKEHETVLTLVGVAVGAFTAAILANNIASKIMDMGGIKRIVWMAGMRAQFTLSTIALKAHTAATWLANAASSAFSVTMAFLTSPITLVILAIAALIAIVIVLVKNWDKVKEIAIKCWEKIKEVWGKVSDWFNENVIQPIVEFFANLWTSITDTVGNIKDTIVDGFNDAIDWLKELPGKALTWGKDFIQGFIDGIGEKVSAVTDAVKGVAEKITSFLHFSVPDEGPLSKYQRWMPDFMQGLADGIDRNKDLVLGAVSKLSSDIDVTVNGKRGANGTSASGVSARTATTAVSNNSSSRTINQTNNFTSQFYGGERETQKNLSKSARENAKDTSAELARALKFA